MAIIADIKWIKIATDIFDNRKIKLIKAMPEGDGILVTWFELLCMAGQCNDDGMVYITREIPYTEESLATVMNKPITTVRLALNTFEQFGMIEVVDNFLRLSNWEKYQNVDGMEKIRQRDREWHRKKRAEQKALLLAEKANVDRMSNDKSTDVDTQNKNKKENKNIDIDNNTKLSLDDVYNKAYRLYESTFGSVNANVCHEIAELMETVDYASFEKAIQKASAKHICSMKYIANAAKGIDAGYDFDDMNKAKGNAYMDAFDALRGELNGEGNGA